METVFIISLILLAGMTGFAIGALGAVVLRRG